MDYKEKYEMALEGIQEILGSGEDSIKMSRLQLRLQGIFPELKESEDERIRKAIHIYLDWLDGKKDYAPRGEYTINDMIDWIEKQGKHQKFRDSIQVGDKVTRNEDGVLVNLSQLNRVEKKDEKQGESKQKVEPKFHKDEWIIHHGTENIYQVVAVIDNQYQLKYGDNYTIQYCADVDRCARLWDIAKDAKDGDILSYRDGQWIFIYKEKIDDTYFSYYTLYSTIHQDLTINDAAFTLLGSAIIPATKEQRDALMKAMADAGYAFDFEKKELKKIEQKPTEWSEEDEQILNDIIKDLVHPWNEYIPDRIEDEIKWLKKRLKSLKDKYTWKPSDEQMDALRYVTNFDYGGYKATLVSLYEQLKKLRGE